MSAGTGTPVRALHVIASLSPLHGGPSEAVIRMCQSLRRVGVDAEIATTDEDGHGGNYNVPLGVATSCAGVTTYYFHCPFLRKYGFSAGFVRWLRRAMPRYHVAHIHGVFSHVTAPAARLARSHGVPYIVRPSGELDAYSLEQGALHKRAYLGLVGRRVLRQAGAVHCTSELERGYVRAQGVAAPLVIPHGVNASAGSGAPRGVWRACHPRVGSRPIILFLSRIAPKKGLDLLVDALARLGSRDAVLVVAGSGAASEEARLRARIATLGLADRTVLTGFVSGVEKSLVLADADLFVLPSRDENFAIAVGEAMAAGLPVVISNQVAFSEDIARAGAGLVVPCAVEPLAEALDRLLQDQDLRDRLGRRGRQWVRRRDDWDQTALSLKDLYHAMVSSPRADCVAAGKRSAP